MPAWRPIDAKRIITPNGVTIVAVTAAIIGTITERRLFRRSRRSHSQFAQPVSGLHGFIGLGVTLHYMTERRDSSLLLSKFDQRETLFQLG